MTPKCCVSKCKNYYKITSKRILKFHEFPKNLELKKKWSSVLLINSNLKDKTDLKVCSEHFMNEDYVDSISGLSKRLKFDAVPSLYLGGQPNSYNRIKENKTAVLLPPRISLPKKILKRVPQSMLFDNMTDDEVKTLTGFTKTIISNIVTLLKLEKIPFETMIDSKSQMIMTLLKYRQGPIDLMMRKLYKIDVDIITRVIEFWTKKMFEYFKSFDFWSLRAKFDVKYAAYIDFTEIIIEKSPDNQFLNIELYSEQCNSYTLKYLTAIDENSIFTFCSDVYGGSSSDDLIIDNSSFLSLLEPGDRLLMARESSGVVEKAAKCGISIECNRLRLDKEKLDKNETRLKYITNLTKDFKLLSQTVPVSMWSIINEVVFNINMLHNVEFIATEE